LPAASQVNAGVIPTRPEELQIIFLSGLLRLSSVQRGVSLVRGIRAVRGGGARSGVSISGWAIGEEDIVSGFFRHRGYLGHGSVRFEAAGSFGQQRGVRAVVALVGTIGRACCLPSSVVRRTLHSAAPLLGNVPTPLPSRAFRSVRGSFERRYNNRLKPARPTARTIMSPRCAA